VVAGLVFEWVSRVPVAGLLGQFSREVAAKVDLAQLLPYWIVLYILISRYGIEGAAAAYVFRSALNYLLLAQQARTLSRMWWMISSSSLLLLCSVIASRLLEPLGPSWILAFLAALAFSVSLGWQFLPKSERDELNERLRRPFGRPAGS
jgi:O-antigen/teichoic acid export membrane protein